MVSIFLKTVRDGESSNSSLPLSSLAAPSSSASSDWQRGGVDENKFLRRAAPKFVLLAFEFNFILHAAQLLCYLYPFTPSPFTPVVRQHRP